MKKPKISVVMPLHNEKKEWAEKAVESILNQSFKDFELIIILDNPKNTELKVLVENYLKKDKRIVFKVNKKNIGLAASLNYGIKISKGIYIARMDGDDISFKNRFEIQYDFMVKNKKIDFLFSWIENIGELDEFKSYLKPNRTDVINIQKTFFKNHKLVHPTLFGKSKVLKKVLYDPNFIRAQDFELWLRTIKKYNFDMIEEILLKYRVPSKDSYDMRILKLKKVSYWGIKGMNKNMKNYIFNLNFWKYYFELLSFKFILLFPESFLKKLILIKDRVK